MHVIYHHIDIHMHINIHTHGYRQKYITVSSSEWLCLWSEEPCMLFIIKSTYTYTSTYIDIDTNSHTDISTDLSPSQAARWLCWWSEEPCTWSLCTSPLLRWVLPREVPAHHKYTHVMHVYPNWTGKTIHQHMLFEHDLDRYSQLGFLHALKHFLLWEEPECTMYVCARVFVCLWACVLLSCMCVQVCVSCVCMRVYVCVRACMYACMCVCVSVHTSIHALHPKIHTNGHKHTHTHTHTHMGVRIQTHAHTHTRKSILSNILYG